MLSDNRHLLRDLPAEAFVVRDPGTFISQWEKGTL
jgi:hypothetical protein